MRAPLRTRGTTTQTNIETFMSEWHFRPFNANVRSICLGSELRTVATVAYYVIAVLSGIDHTRRTIAIASVIGGALATSVYYDTE